MRVLVVDDEPYVAELIQQVLEADGNVCVLAESASAADRVLDGDRVDAATLDVAMPGRDGIAWLEDLAARDPALARRTLVVSGVNLSARDLERISRCGAGFLAKPFRLERLRDAFRSQALLRAN